MVSISFLDNVLSRSGHTARSMHVGEDFVAAALRDLEQIDRIDRRLPQDHDEPFDSETAALILKMYQQWTESTAALIERIDRLEKQHGAVPRSDSLRHGYGRVMAMLSCSLDGEEAHSIEDAEPTIPHEEVRRELRAAVH